MCRRKQGVNKSRPLCPFLFCAVYEDLHCTLLQRFRTTKFLVSMDNIKFISPNAGKTRQLLSKFFRIRAVLGFRINKTKKEMYNGPIHHQ